MNNEKQKDSSLEMANNASEEMESNNANNSILLNDLEDFPSFENDEGMIVPNLFNQLILFIIDYHKEMLAGEAGNSPYEQVYYAFSNFIEDLTGFRFKNNYAFGVIAFAKEASLALDITEVNNITFGFLPTRSEQLSVEPTLLDESNLIPALNLAEKISLTYEENKRDNELPIYVNLVILTPSITLDMNEIEAIINQLTSHKNYRVYFGLWNELDSLKRDRLSSHLSFADDLRILTNKHDVLQLLKKAASDNYRFKI